ncbi:MAG: 3-dehydroquinate synthase [Blastochloris sp.]|nr:3-dehydroquinate synthase [Blastochloris sp.]
MEIVPVVLGARSYEVHIGQDLFAQCLAGFDFSGGIALITDTNVAKQDWFVPFKSRLEQLSSKVVCYEVEAGEKAKALPVFTDLCSRLAQDRFPRSATVVAVGGGVVGDLAGYVAASYLRGVAFIQVPTTLLAAVDSSVGGKTGVNLPEGKNLVGAFYQPQKVLIDPSFLKTLPERELAAGMAEVIKYGLIRDAAFFQQMAQGRPKDLAPVIKRCVEIKAQVVAGDEREESGLRAILNFGHTLGHAIEQSVGYGELLHGEAIAIGMVAATLLSEECCGLKEGAVKQVRAAFAANGLPVGFAGLSYEKLEPALLRDKKVSAAGLQWVLLSELGRTELRRDVTEAQVRRALAACTL